MSTRYCTLEVTFAHRFYPGLDSVVEGIIGAKWVEAGSDCKSNANGVTFTYRSLTFMFYTLAARRAAITKLQAFPLVAHYGIEWSHGMPGIE